VASISEPDFVNGTFSIFKVNMLHLPSFEEMSETGHYKLFGVFLQSARSFKHKALLSV